MKLPASVLLILATATTAWAETAAVTVYRGVRQRGPSERFTTDVADFATTSVGDNRARSLRIDPGCEVILYSGPDFTGASLTLRKDIDTLSGTAIGPGDLSSMRVTCRQLDQQPNARRQVEFFSGPGYTGKSWATTGDVATFEGTPLGGRDVGSVRVGRGCVVSLHARPDFEGELLVVPDDLTEVPPGRLPRGSIGSAKVDCSRGAVTFYTEVNLDGEAHAFDTFERDLAGTPLGTDRARSVRVAPGCWAVVFADPDFRGVSYRVVGAVRDLHQTRVGRDSVSSFKVECGPSGGPGR
jgi:hypothetical protein